MTKKKFYGSSYNLLLSKQSQISSILDKILKDFPGTDMTNRIKSPKSMEEKLKKKNVAVNEAEALNSVTDALGFRIVCRNKEEVYQIADAIIDEDDFIHVETKDYIKHPKKNGYQSLHLIMEMLDGFCFEIQVRTYSIHRFAKVEHFFIYKNPLKRWFGKLKNQF